jgi:hypothetical protein
MQSRRQTKQCGEKSAGTQALPVGKLVQIKEIKERQWEKNE